MAGRHPGERFDSARCRTSIQRMNMEHYSGHGNAAADGCGIMALMGIGLLVLTMGGLVIWLVTSM